MENKNLVNCPDCGHLCSKGATTCPKCGNTFKMSPANLLAYIVLFIGGLIITFWILGTVF